MSTWHVNGKNAVTVVSAVFLAIISLNPVHADSLRPLSQYVIVQAAIDGVLAAAGGFPDCNGNGIDDALDIADLTSPDCNGNGIPDECELAGNDCNGDGRPDECGVFITCDSTEDQKLTASGGQLGGGFGQALSISGDTAVLGAAFVDCAVGPDCGAVYVYHSDGTNWIEQQKLTPSDAAAGDSFGTSVSISGDTFVTGTLWANCAAGFQCGSAYVYRFDGTNWIEEQKLTAPDAAEFDKFGISVSASGDAAIVGASGDNCPILGECGAAFVYRFDGTNWIEQQKLTAFDAIPVTEFGFSVSISGETVVIGAPTEHCFGSSPGVGRCGSVYVFRFDGTNWIEEQKLTASDGTEFDEFGYSVTVSGDTAIVGARLVNCASGTDCGAAYVYRFDGTSWIEKQKLTASDASAADRFGEPVSISGRIAVVGARGARCAAGGGCGSVYVYRYDGTDWIEVQKLTASDAAKADEFGKSVSVSGSVAVVGPLKSDCADGGSVCGAAYFFELIDEDCSCDGVADQCETDCNENGIPDECEGLADSDGDGVPDPCDACPGSDDAIDGDGDGIPDDCDVCPNGSNTVDSDGDGVFDGCDICPDGDDGVDSDGDGVPDDCDLCPGGNDSVDSDGDGVPDACDVCPGGDDTIDGDGDAIPDDCDVCPNGSNTVDSDGDGVFDGCDVCPGGDDTIDSDADGVPDACDRCPGADDTMDDDGDGVPDDCDVCPGGDDSLDGDTDGVPDGCDVCLIGDDNLDTDGDGVPNACDVCEPPDDTIDSDGDGVPDACDVCPGADDSVDGDGDGVPDGCDVCQIGDDHLDADGDGVPDDCDVCPGVDDSNFDLDGDGVPDECDICPGGDDTIDSDGDGLPDDCDDCDTAVPEECDILPPILAQPPHNCRKNRYISIDPRGTGGFNAGKNFDIRLTLTDTLVIGVTVVGSQWWANDPDAACISVVGPTQPATPLNWDACPTLHLTGCPIIPTASYEIVAVVQDGLESFPPFEAETQLRPHSNKWWGDAIGFFTGTEWTGPQGSTNFDDTTAAVKTFQNPNAINATHVSVTDIHPNRPDVGGISAHPNKVVNIDDVFQFMRAFQGFQYPGGAIHLCPDP